MSQEKRPPTPAAIVERYDPRQSPASVPQAAESQATSPQAPADLAQARPAADATSQPAAQPPKPVEIGGPSGPEPTRYGDWERNGRVSDF
ncbi:MAG TPA: DUF1674 domain-containing protein [Terriglobales bacterium]|nr:DUF1674 domain-containing protein [Terriglobales bacterium]